MESRVQPPAVALLIASGISFLLSLAFLGIRIFGISLGSLLGDMPSASDALTGGMAIASSAIGLLVQGFIFYAGLKMMNMEKWPLAVAGAALAIVPCFGCCCINVPVGIWALVVLLLPDTRTSFAG